MDDNRDLTIKVTEIEERAKSNSHRIDRLEHKQDELDNIVRSVALMAQEQEHIKADVAEIKKGVSELKGRSGKRWDAVVDKILLAIIGGIVVYVLSKIGF